MSNANEKVGVGKILKSLRLVNDYYVIDLADEMGVAMSDIISIETNQRQPTDEEMDKYSKVFKMSKAAILMFDEPEEQDGLLHQVYNVLERIINRFDL